MRQNEFLERLRSELFPMASGDISSILDYYREYIEDAVEAGRNEEEVIAGIGDIRELAKALKAENNRDKDWRYIEKSVVLLGGLERVELGLVSFVVSVERSWDGEARMEYSCYEETMLEVISSGGVLGLKERTDFPMGIIERFRSALQRRKPKPLYCKVFVPEGSEPYITISHVNGSVTVMGVSASGVMVTSVNAKLRLENSRVSGNIVYKTTNGKITVANASASSVIADTVNGGIELNDLTTPKISCKTLNGNVHCEVRGQPRDYMVDFSSTNGSIRFDGNSAGKRLVINAGAEGEIKIRTLNGNGAVAFLSVKL